ncbi:MAG: hypothetical protein AAFP70_13010, partial [Calditrichota bacterium]
MIKRLRFLGCLPFLLWLVSALFFSNPVSAQGLKLPTSPRGVATLSDPVYVGMERMASDSLIYFKPFQNFRRVLEFD